VLLVHLELIGLLVAAAAAVHIPLPHLLMVLVEDPVDLLRVQEMVVAVVVQPRQIQL
jgi:hypothetical protein